MRKNIKVSTLIVGAGFSGIALGASLRERGFPDFLIVDRGSDFGGTWYSNTYPGAECDIQSHLYSFSFSPNPNWTKTYATQPEIYAYLAGVAKREGLYEKVAFEEHLEEAKWDEGRGVWEVRTSSMSIEASALVLATGHLSDPKLPTLEGFDKYRGKIFHSATWDHEYDFSGKRVAVVGTGASAIQIVPEVADLVSQLVVLQRSAPYVVPRHDTVYSDARKEMFAKAPDTAMELREFLFWSNENRFLQRMMVPEYLEEVDRVAREHRENQIVDPELLKKVTPDYIIGCKRILLSNTWYPALSRENVELVDRAFAGFCEDGIVDASGVEHDVDCVIFCSGYEAAELPIAKRVVGKNAIRLKDVWSRGSEAYGGISVTNFPNMFLMNGPHVGLGAGSIIFMIEAQAQYVAGGISHLAETEWQPIEVRPEAQDEFVQHLTKRSKGTVWTEGNCQSWYIDGRSGQLTTIWPDQMNRYHALFSSFDINAYRAARTPEMEAV